MTKIDQRSAIDTLPKSRLLKIAAVLDLHVTTRLSRSELVTALASSRQATFPRILELLTRDELKAICRVAGIDDSGREKARIADRILRRRLRKHSTVSTIKRADLVEDVVGATGLSKVQAEVAVNTVFKSIAEALSSGSRVELRGFGSFVVRRRRPSIGRNLGTGEEVKIPARSVPCFRPGKELKRAVES